MIRGKGAGANLSIEIRLVRVGQEAQNLRSTVLVEPIMIRLQYRCSLMGLCLLAVMGAVRAADTLVIWPADWEVESLPPAEGSQSPVQMRQRAVKNDQNGNPVMVVELTQSRLQAGHEVNVQGVLLEMRKAVQINFVRSGYQSVCTQVKPGLLSTIPSLETTCTITQNGGHVMTQTLVAAASKETAWALSYAGSAQGYEANKEEVLRIRDGLRLGVTP